MTDHFDSTNDDGPEESGAGKSLIDAVANPIVFERDGKVFATSRDVATFFGKQHRHVLDSIDSLVKQEPSLAGGGLPTFRHTPYLVEATGQRYRMYTMDRDGFTLLAMGFTGQKALQWKMRYLQAFNAMEQRLKEQAAGLPLLSNAAALRDILIGYTERVVQLEAKVEVLTEDSEALERIAKADGSLNVTEVAKNLGMRPKDLFDWLSQNGWTYRRPGAKAWLGYHDKCNRGLLIHKSTAIKQADGSDKISEQVRVTAKGLTVLAKKLGKVIEGDDE